MLGWVLTRAFRYKYSRKWVSDLGKSLPFEIRIVIVLWTKIRTVRKARFETKIMNPDCGTKSKWSRKVHLEFGLWSLIQIRSKISTVDISPHPSNESSHRICYCFDVLAMVKLINSGEISIRDWQVDMRLVEAEESIPGSAVSPAVLPSMHMPCWLVQNFQQF